VHPKITKGVYGVLSVDASVKSRASLGGTAPKNVTRAARLWRKRLGAEKPRENRSA
jgi:argininosuccinate lyase